MKYESKLERHRKQMMVLIDFPSKLPRGGDTAENACLVTSQMTTEKPSLDDKSWNGLKTSRSAGGDGGGDGGGGSGGSEMTRCDVMRTDASALLLHHRKGIRFMHPATVTHSRQCGGGILPKPRLGFHSTIFAGRLAAGALKTRGTKEGASMKKTYCMMIIHTRHA
jgi:hypothetical protein